ncbi:MAG TPA: hypothetical protein ENJ20_00610, partial [Bacteroidetes bacterium]|nr:hypothetical protein [Bacteroidota bacterium]
MNKPILPFVLSLFFFTCLTARQIDRVLGDVIVQLKPTGDIGRLVKDLRYFHGVPTQITIEKELSPPLHIWLLHFDFAKINEHDFLENIKKQRQVIHAQFNHLGRFRQVIPDDPAFDQQWMWLNAGQTNGLPDAD